MQKLRENYPQYKDIDDVSLAKKIVAKYPQYQEAFKEYLVEPQAQPSPYKEMIVNQPQAKLKQSIQQLGGENIPAGIFNLANTGFSQVGGLLGAADTGIREAVKNVPYLSEVTNLGLDVLGAIPKATGWAAENLIAKPALGYLGAIVPNYGQSPEQSQKTSEAILETARNVGAFEAPAAIKAVPKAIGATARTVLPPAERVYSPAAKLGGIGEEAEAATYGVKNRVKIGGSYKFQPKNYENIKGKIETVVNEKLNPAIEQLEKSGVSLDRATVLKQVNDYLKQNFSGLKTPAGKARYQKALESLNEEFKQGGEKITPKEMQEGKTATHREATYDAEGQITNEFNKAVSHIYRKKLEEWNPNLAGINKELLNLDILSESIYREAMRSSKSLPKGETSAPFYIAIANPLRGAAIAGTRGAMSTAGVVSKAAFLIDRLQQMGKKTTDVTNVSQPLNIPPPQSNIPMGDPRFYSDIDMIKALNRPTTPELPPQPSPKFYSKVDVAKAQNRFKGAPVIPPDVQYIGMQGDMPLFQYKNIGSFSVPKGMTFQQAFENFKSRFSL